MRHEPDPNDGRHKESDPPANVASSKASVGSTQSGGNVGSEGILSALSSLIDNNLRVFRAGAATMVIGSGLTVAFLAYRRGFHVRPFDVKEGFSSAAQVPASYFKRRKKVRVRVASVVAAGQPRSGTSGKGYGSAVDGRGDGTSSMLARDGSGASSGGGKTVDTRQGADVLLHTEHITLLRRFLHLPPRSLGPNTNTDSSDSATFVLRLCGVSAEEGGVASATEHLTRPLDRFYCDAELLFQERKDPDSEPIAVCHLHRRRRVFWRQLLQTRLDPHGGFGEYMLAQGVARLREEHCWADSNKNERRRSSSVRTIEGKVQAEKTGVNFESRSARQPLLLDRERFTVAEANAKTAGRGLWAHMTDETTHTNGREKGHGNEEINPLKWATRALARLFGRR